MSDRNRPGGLPPRIRVTTIRPRVDTGTIYVVDLKVGQVERIEREVGLPLHRWRASDSWMDILIRIAIEVQGGTEDEYRDMTFRELTALVDFEDPNDESGDDSPEDEDEPAGAPDPKR